MDYDLSVIIPSRNEPFLARTVEDILEKRQMKTQIIIALDGHWDNPRVPDHPDVITIHYSEPIGQRACMNKAARLSKAKYIMKTDAHCAFDEGFDKKMISKMRDDWTMTAPMKHLHAYDWICPKCKWRRYQGAVPEKCDECGNMEGFYQEFVWKPKPNQTHDSFSFNFEPQMRYFKEYRERDEYKKMKEELGLTYTMSLQGSLFLCTRERYFTLELCDEKFGPWGSQGIEVAVKTWLSGGRCVVNQDTWYAHHFRNELTPYDRETRNYRDAREYANKLFFNNDYDKAILNFHWLLERFWPVTEWTDEMLVDMRSRAK